jgi:outer membrane lipoprotein-sorting protein
MSWLFGHSQQVKTMRTRTVAAAVLLVLGAVPAIAQSADDIVEKHLAASGGRAAYNKITSRTATGAITLTSPVGDLSGTIELYSKKPNKSRTLIKLDLTPLGAGPVVSDQRFDGNSAYVMDSLQGNRSIEGSQLEAMQSGSFPSPLLNYKELGATITMGDREKVGGKDVYVLRMTPKAGPPVRLFIDAESFMMVKTALTINVPQLGGDIEQVVEFSDFRVVDGIKVPFVTKSSNPAQTVTAKMTTITHNTEIDDASFAKPPGQ